MNCEQIMQIFPNRGLGELMFGQNRDDVRSQLGPDYVAFKKTPGASRLTDAYNRLGLHLYYDEADRLNFIEAFPPSHPTIDEVNLLGGNARSLLQKMEQRGHAGRVEGDSWFFDDIGVALYAPGGSVEGVSIYPPDYYGRK